MLECTIAKEGKACIFMKKSGCSYNGGKCHTVVETCEGCLNVEKLPAGDFCGIFAEPSLKWVTGMCNMASHAQNGTDADDSSKRINPLKASKRSRR